jgi:putative ABC transport system substrate-binding protein
MIKLRLAFSVIAVLVWLFSPGVVEAQQTARVDRIGYLVTSLAAAPAEQREAFRQGLRELGYAEGRNVVIEYRDAEGKSERLPALAAELVALKVDVIVTGGGTLAALAAKQATKTLPIVFVSVGDPVTSGLVISLARPGGNATGLSVIAPELAGKRLELITLAVQASRTHARGLSGGSRSRGTGPGGAAPEG